jgi:hypothetical protein
VHRSCQRQGRGPAKYVPDRGAAVIQAGQSSRPPRWQQCAAVVVSAQCVVRRVTTLGSGADSASRRFAASFRYDPSDNAFLPSRRGITKPAHGFTHRRPSASSTSGASHRTAAPPPPPPFPAIARRGRPPRCIARIAPATEP